jgi:hypothetical protein
VSDRLAEAVRRATELADKVKTLQDDVAARRGAMAAAKVRALARKGRCRLATGWFAAWSRQVNGLAGVVIALDKTTAKLRRVDERVRELSARAPAQARKQARTAAFLASMEKRLDALRVVAPELQKKWNAERKAEDKRIKKRLRELRERHAEVERAPKFEEPRPLTQDEREAWLRPLVQQPTDVSRGFTPNVAPAFLSLLDEHPIPPEWTARHVGVRLIDADRVIRSLPERIGPKSFGRAWPAYVNDEEPEEVADGRRRPKPTPFDIARAEEAVSWPIQFLSNQPGYALGALAYWASRAETPDEENTPTELLEIICSALNAAKEPVR